MRVFLIITLFSINFLSHAESKKKNEFYIQIENDAAFQTDKYYSNGLEFMYQRRFFRAGSLTKLRFGVSHKIYTPEATLSTTVVEGDYPYTGLYYGILGFSHANSSFYFRADLWVGHQGPDAKAGVFQNLFHKMTPSSEVNGWAHQTANSSFLNGEFKLIKIFKGSFLEVSPWIAGHYGGLIRDAEVGLKLGLSLGVMELFGNISMVAHYYNSTLQGPENATSVYVIDAQDMEKFYYKADTGIHFKFNSFRLTLKANWYGAQFIGARSHTYGTIETAFYY